MPGVFISYARADLYFVRLLAAVLEFYRVPLWWDNSGIEPGDFFAERISQGITDANHLLVVVSKNTLQSRWVLKETVMFQERNPNQRIIPLLLDQTSPHQILPDLHKYQSINFQPCLYTGFTQLMNCFEHQFLQLSERRENEENRRQIPERRKVLVLQRMRYGFWLFYEQNFGATPLDTVEIMRGEMLKLKKALAQEACRYQYFDKESAQECDHETILEAAIEKVWEEVNDQPKMKIKHVIEMIADNMFKHYRVVMIDRRKTSDRRSSNPYVKP